jgi:hypothetical protein
MNEITIKTQAELDALPTKFDEFTRVYIQGGTRYDRIIVRGARENASVVARENASVVAWGNASVEARENASVVARENASVMAWGNASVEARENASIVALENASVVARENASVVAWGNVGVHLQSDFATVVLFMFAVCWRIRKGKSVEKKSKNATIIDPVSTPGTSGWLENQGIEEKDTITLFKRVSKEFKTQENTTNETTWSIGATLTHSSWMPTDKECGLGKYHACSRPYFCDEFRSNIDDRYIAIQVKKEDLHAWENGDYPHKIAFREGTVLYECDRFGKQL